jgi:hypothetical protein
MTTSQETLVIGYKRFIYGHALSFTEQPYLEELFTAVRNKKKPVTLVMGAGVSMNAGLRSWRDLIKYMTYQIHDDNKAGQDDVNELNHRLQEMLREDQSDLMRKAEIVLQLVKDRKRSRPEHQIICDALYQADLLDTPGPLAMSIARFVRARDRDVRVVTTNFDTLVEEALKRVLGRSQVRSYSLDRADVWQESLRTGAPEQRKVGVLHLHGIIERAKPAKGPIVLTESQFFKHGATVRRVLFETLADSCSIFVGLGMSDPNLIGPLYEMKNTRNRNLRFALVVPQDAPGAQDELDSAYYAVESAKSLENELGLKTVLLNSYSQLNQVLADLSLAIVEPDRYDIQAANRPDTLVYVKRHARALDECYSAIGCDNSEQTPVKGSADALSEKLHTALHARNGPLDLLRTFADPTRMGELGSSEGENFALFLWLRSRQRPKTEPSYALRLVGTSAYVYREEWAARHHQTVIARHSTSLAASAVFNGNAQVGPALEPPWKGIFAVPIVVGSSGSDEMIGKYPADVLTIGAITLNSTYEVPTKGDDAPYEGAVQQSSVMCELDAHATSKLAQLLQNTAIDILWPRAP